MAEQVKRQNLEKKIIEICLTPKGKKKLEIVPRNLEISEVFLGKHSRDLHFSRNANLKILKSIGQALEEGLLVVELCTTFTAGVLAKLTVGVGGRVTA